MYENHSSKRATLMFPSKELLLEFLSEVFTHEFDINSQWLSISAHFKDSEIQLAKSKFQASLATDTLE